MRYTPEKSGEDGDGDAHVTGLVRGGNGVRNVELALNSGAFPARCATMSAGMAHGTAARKRHADTEIDDRRGSLHGIWWKKLTPVVTVSYGARRRRWTEEKPAFES